MGGRAGGGARSGGGGAPTAAQMSAAQSQYKAAKAAYDAASQAINSPSFGYGKGWEKTQAKFQKASDRYEKAKAKLTKLKNAKKIAGYNSGISYAGVSTSTKGWNAEMKATYKAMTTKGGYSPSRAKQVINSQKHVYQGGGGGTDIPLF